MDVPNMDAMREVREIAAAADDAQDDAIEAINAFFVQDGASDEELLQQLSVDRTYLVRGISKENAVPPYGSMFYATTDIANSMLSLKAYYRQSGFELTPEAHDAADYLGVELLFAAEILDRAAGAYACGDMAGANTNELPFEFLKSRCDSFIATFVKPLVDAYVPQALGFAKTGYCKGMLMLLQEFVAEDANELQVAVIA